MRVASVNSDAGGTSCGLFGLTLSDVSLSLLHATRLATAASAATVPRYVFRIFIISISPERLRRDADAETPAPRVRDGCVFLALRARVEAVGHFRIDVRNLAPR